MKEQKEIERKLKEKDDMEWINSSERELKGVERRKKED